MNLFRIFQHHPRADLSAHADGQLSQEAGERVENHVETCPGCREELASLRTLRSALAAMPEVRAPRSFALTPQMTEAPARQRAASGPGPAFIAMRVAGAGVAAVLALVVFIDSDNSGSQLTGNDDSAAWAPSSETSERMYDAGFYDSGNVAPGATEHVTLAAAPSPQAGGAGEDDKLPPDPQPADGAGVEGNAPDSSSGTPADVVVPGSGDGGQGAGGTAGGVGGGADADSATATPGDLATQVELTVADPDKSSLEHSIDGDDSGLEAAAEAHNADDDGISTMTVIQVALAVVAATALLGGFVLPRLVKKDI